PDLKPVPEPTVRDLSVPQAKPRVKKADKPEPIKEIAPADEGEVISAREVAAATTAEILGKSADAKAESKSERAKTEEKKPVAGKAKAEAADKPAAPATDPVVTIADGTVPAPAPRPRLAPKKPKPITVASTPLIGNYQLPTIDFLQMPDLTVKPTE